MSAKVPAADYSKPNVGRDKQKDRQGLDRRVRSANPGGKTGGLTRNGHSQNTWLKPAAATEQPGQKQPAFDGSRSLKMESSDVKDEPAIKGQGQRKRAL